MQGYYDGTESGQQYPPVENPSLAETGQLRHIAILTSVKTIAMTAIDIPAYVPTASAVTIGCIAAQCSTTTTTTTTTTCC